MENLHKTLSLKLTKRIEYHLPGIGGILVNTRLGACNKEDYEPGKSAKTNKCDHTSACLPAKQGMPRAQATGSSRRPFRDDRTYLRFSHSKEQIGLHNPRDERLIEDAFPFRREGDLLLLVSAPDRKSAGLGLWRVITEILSQTP